jgi:hypothetical protein
LLHGNDEENERIEKKSKGSTKPKSEIEPLNNYTEQNPE